MLNKKLSLDLAVEDKLLSFVYTEDSTTSGNLSINIITNQGASAYTLNSSQIEDLLELFDTAYSDIISKEIMIEDDV